MNINKGFLGMLFVCLIISGAILAFLAQNVDPKTAKIKLGSCTEKIIIINVIEKKEPIRGFFYIPNTGRIQKPFKGTINI